VIFIVAEGFLLGFAVAVSPGAITTYAVKVGIRDGFRSAWLVGLGAATVDACYCLLALFGIASWIVGFPPARTAMLVIGGLVLTYLASVSLLEGLMKDATSRQATRESHHVPYLTGLAMTALNPLTVGFWVAVGSAVFSARTDFSPTSGALFALAVFAGSALWFTILATLVHAGRRFINDILFRLLTCAAGLILLFFGLSLFYRAVL
jgi:threonine/homoserine/homoserine lactone efflux protein